MGFDVYTGNLGSGKSLDATLVIYDYLKQGKNVIANYRINEYEIEVDKKIDYSHIKNILFSDIKSLKNMKKNKKADKENNFFYVDTNDLSVLYLIWFNKKYHKAKTESQTLVVIDEASFIFNSRTWNDSSRMDWITFIKLSRKLGFDLILITQDINDIDKQLRRIFDYNVIHKKLTSYKIFKWLSFLKISMFVKVFWNMSIDKKDRAEFFIYKNRYSKLYDTYDTMSDILQLFKYNESDLDSIEKKQTI